MNNLFGVCKNGGKKDKSQLLYVHSSRYAQLIYITEDARFRIHLHEQISYLLSHRASVIRIFFLQIDNFFI